MCVSENFGNNSVVEIPVTLCNETLLCFVNVKKCIEFIWSLCVADDPRMSVECTVTSDSSTYHKTTCLPMTLGQNYEKFEFVHMRHSKKLQYIYVCMVR